MTSNFDSKYYDALEIATTADRVTIAKAYRHLALLNHPLRNDFGRRAEFLRKFNSLAEAYDVLSDPIAKRVYDKLGVQALQLGVTEEDGLVWPGFCWHGDSFSTFAAVFGSSNPYCEDLEQNT